MTRGRIPLFRNTFTTNLVFVLWTRKQNQEQMVVNYPNTVTILRKILGLTFRVLRRLEGYSDL